MGTTANLSSVGQLCPLTYRVICGNLAGFLLPCVYVGFSSGAYVPDAHVAMLFSLCPAASSPVVTVHRSQQADSSSGYVSLLLCLRAFAPGSLLSCSTGKLTEEGIYIPGATLNQGRTGLRG